MAPEGTRPPRRPTRGASIRARRDYRRLCDLREKLGALLELRPLSSLPDAVARFEWAGALLDIARLAWRARGREPDTLEEQALVRALDTHTPGGQS